VSRVGPWQRKGTSPKKLWAPMAADMASASAYKPNAPSQSNPSVASASPRRT